MTGPALLLQEFIHLFTSEKMRGPVLDLACGDCSNGILVAAHDQDVVCYDKSRESLEAARECASKAGVRITVREVDLEVEGADPLPAEAFGGILVFRYLHRPLIPCIRKALRPSGILIYETYTLEQRRFGKPMNADHLLKPGELMSWFLDWEIIHSFEGILENPARAMSQLVCRKLI